MSSLNTDEFPVKQHRNRGGDTGIQQVLQTGSRLANAAPGEEVVITGMAGRFPKADDVYQFRDNLLNKVDMVTAGNRNCSVGHSEMPERSGKINHIDKFDAGFFEESLPRLRLPSRYSQQSKTLFVGIHQLEADTMDPLCRQLLERSFEALVDSGYNPKELRGTRTGVYVGVFIREGEKPWFYDKLQSGYGVTGCITSMQAQRVSYFLGFDGPAYTIDSACSTSLYALEHGYRAIRTGRCESALVAGVNLCLNPLVTLEYARLGVLSLDGACKSLDVDANGYVRAEAISVVYLQKAKNARRIYAQILHAKTNCDGFKEQGITYPSWFDQCQLFKEVCQECNVDPTSVDFVEGHFTGTKIGDSAEIRSIQETYCVNRKRPLLTGSIKSNIGHAEGSSGLCAIIKVLLGMESNCIYPNINYKCPPPGIKALETGRIVVVTETHPWPDNGLGIAAVNNLGFGGANANVLLKKWKMDKINYGQPRDDMPRLVCVSGRTTEAVTAILDNITTKPLDQEFIRLLHEVFKNEIPGHIYRGYITISKSGEMSKSWQWFDGNSRPLCLVFNCANENWLGVGKALSTIPLFTAMLQKIQKMLLPKGVDVMETLTVKQPSQNAIHTIIGSIAVQLALVDLLKTIELPIDYIVSYSTGEVISAYVDNALTLEQAVLCGYYIGLYFYTTSKNIYPIQTNGYKTINWKSISKSKLNHVSPMSVHNSTVSQDGDCEQPMYESTPVDSNNNLKLLNQLKELIPHPKHRSLKWIADDQLLFGQSGHASAEYFVTRILNSVVLKDSLFNIPQKVMILEVGSMPTNLQHTSVKLDCEDISRSQSITPLLCTLGKLYELGYNLKLEKLYPAVPLPVSASTPMISPLIKWNHSDNWFVPSHPRQAKLKLGYHRTITFGTDDSEWSYMTGHNIDGLNLIPATGYLTMVWETFATIKGIPMSKIKIAFENVKFHKAIVIPNAGKIKLTIGVLKITGEFEIEELGQTVVTGRVYLLEDCQEEELHLTATPKCSEQVFLTQKDIYKELKLRGYYYKDLFCGLNLCDLSCSSGKIGWRGNWTTFLDSMLQMKILQDDTRILYVPFTIQKLTINAEKHMQYVQNLGEHALIPVCSFKEGNLIKSGAIAIKGFVGNSFPRRKQPQPVLEIHKFVPFETEIATQDSVRVLAQILVENTHGNKLHIVEVIDEHQPLEDIPLSPMFYESLQNEPLVQHEIFVLTPKPLKLNNVAVKNTRLREETNLCSLVICTLIFNKPKILNEALAVLQEHGMLLSRETLAKDIKSIRNSIYGLDIISVHNTQTERLILLRKTNKLKIPTIIDVSGCTMNYNWLLDLKSSLKNDKPVLLVAQNEPTNGLLGLFNCLKQEPGGFNIRCVLILDKTPTFCINKEFYSEQLEKGLRINVFKDGKWGTYRHLILTNADTVEREHVFNNITVRGDFSSLRWIEGPLTSKSILSPEKSLVYVYYSSLNFRDVMTASGRISNDVITKDRIEQLNVQGFEYCGRDASGKRIMGMVNTGALASVVAADPYLMWQVPDTWSMEEAVTVPVVYGTILYSFLKVDFLRHDQNILIHAGTGGVGQAAINIALHFNCNIFVTVGNQEKRDFIKNHFPQIPEHHIGNSRDTSFEQVVMKQTNGKGVDVVLNSLAGEKLQSSVRCLAPGGKFIEIGKYDIAKDTVLGQSSFANSRSFHGVTFDAVFTENASVKGSLHRLIADGLRMGYIKPLQRTIFKKEEVEQAFRYMAAGKHIGKIVVELRQEEEKLETKTQIKLFKGLASSDNCYIIVGGLGGFGLELSDWLITRGVRKLMLVSRHGLTCGYQASRIRIWKSYGVVTTILTADLTKEKNCVNIIKEADKLGSVEGIFNLAAVLQDSLLENQSKKSFMASLNPKAVATQNLDAVSRKMCSELKYFVVFSSLSSGRGIAGQTNYGMANSIMERICENRRNHGYPALAIQWGAIGEVGLLENMKSGKEISGTIPQSITSCLSVMDTFLSLDDPVVASMVLPNKKDVTETADGIVTTIMHILGLKDLKTVSLYSTLSELGMDSMMAVEINQTLKRKYELHLTAKEIRKLTFKRLQEIAENGVTIKKQHQFKNGKHMFYQLLSDIATSNTVDVPVVRLKSCIAEEAAAPTIFLLPGIEGTSSIFESLASKLHCHSFCLQFIQSDMADLRIENIAKSLILHIQERLQNTAQFVLVAYSYGCIIALHIASLLERNNYRGTVVLIDGGPAILNELVACQRKETESVMHINVICSLLELHIPHDILSKYRENMINCKTFEDRVNVILTHLPKNTVHSKLYLRQLCMSTYARIRSIILYKPKFTKLKSVVKLCRPYLPLVENFDYDYKIQELCEKVVEVKMFKGDHLTILKNGELSNAINKIIEESSYVDGET